MRRVGKEGDEKGRLAGRGRKRGEGHIYGREGREG